MDLTHDSSPPGQPLNKSTVPPPSHVMLLILIVITANVLIVTVGQPKTFWEWSRLLLGALLDALVVANVLTTWLYPVVATGGRKLRTLFRKLIEILGRGPKLIALVLPFLLIAGLSSPWWGEKLPRIGACPHPTQLRMLSSPESLDTARQLAQQYERWTAEIDGGCPTVSVYAYSSPASRSGEAFVESWTANSLGALRPRPDLWLADSSFDVRRVRAMPNVLDIEQRRIASSPLVFGVAASTIGDLLNGGRDDHLQWTDLVQKAIKLNWGLVRPDPTASPMGQATTAVMYGIENPIDPALARAIEQRVGQSLDNGRYPLGPTADGLSVLCHHRQLVAQSSKVRPPTAVVVSEQALLKFNRGDPLGGECGRVQDSEQLADPFKAYYPSDARSLDVTLVQLKWHKLEPARAQGPDGAAQGRDAYAEQRDNEANAFGGWLSGKDGHQALLAAGLRPQGDSAQVGTPLQLQEVNEAIEQYDSARRPARVLFALDASGSMEGPTGTGGVSRFDLASAGVLRALERMGERDEFGLSPFSTDVVGTGVRDAIPLGLRDTPVREVSRRDATVELLARIAPAGDTPLYRAIAEGLTMVGGSNDGQVSALVVLTDGEDTASEISLVQIADAVQVSGVRVFVIAVGDTQCAFDALRTVSAPTGGACFDADLETLDVTVADVLSALWRVR